MGHHLVPVGDTDESDEESKADAGAAAREIVMSGNAGKEAPKFRAEKATTGYSSGLAGELSETDSYIG